MKIFAAALGAVAPLVVLSTTQYARAGVQPGNAEFCVEYSTLTNGVKGYCSGNLFGFAVANNTTDYAGFAYGVDYGYDPIQFPFPTNGTPWGQFEAVYNGTVYYCDISTQYYNVYSAWPATVAWGAGYGQFGIFWDANGLCSYLYLSNSTLYSNPQ